MSDVRLIDEAVVITGMGAVTPLGSSFDEIADALMAGRSGVRAIDPGLHARESVQFAAPVDRIPVPSRESCDLTADEFAKLDRLERFCLSAAASALADANMPRKHGWRIGIVLGIGAEQLKAWEFDFLAGGDGVFAGHRQRTLVHRLADRLRLRGPAITVAAACASSGYAMALGRGWIKAGWVDACVVGGCDVLSPTSIAAFYNLRALSRRNDDPAKASRPFDEKRDGFVMGEGGAFFVLEQRRNALDRGQRIHGELAGVGMSSDGMHMVIPNADPLYASRAISEALADADIDADEVDYINAHAAGTPVGDVAEAGAIRLAFGAVADTIPVSSTKGMSGHMVSGAAAFEAIACLAAIDRQTVPPTLNLDHPDPQCALDHVPHVGRPRRIRVAASNSFGFGGSNLCLVIKAA